jgi:hypothetical protein
MKKILLILMLLPLFASAQFINKNTGYGTSFNRTGADTLLFLPRDTFPVPSAYLAYAFVARKGTDIYVWNTSSHIWELSSGGGAAGGWANLGTGYGLINVNDSTYRVDTTLIATQWYANNGINKYRFGVSGEDEAATSARYFNANQFGFTIDSASQIRLRTDDASFTTRIDISPGQIFERVQSTSTGNFIESTKEPGTLFILGSWDDYLGGSDGNISIEGSAGSLKGGLELYGGGNRSYSELISHHYPSDTTADVSLKSEKLNTYHSRVLLNRTGGIELKTKRLQAHTYKGLSVDLNHQVFIDSIASVSDTTNYKPVTINTSTGQLVKHNYWPSGGGTPTLQQVLDAGSSLATSETVDINATTFTIAGDDATWDTRYRQSITGIKLTRLPQIGGKSGTLDVTDSIYLNSQNTTGPESRLIVYPDSIVLRPNAGVLRFKNLPVGVGTKALRIDATGNVTAADTTAGGAVSFGTDNQIPYTNAGATDFDYSSTFTYDGTTLNVDGAATFNDAGANVDFRIEGDADANAFFVDASADAVGIGTNAPGAKLDIQDASDTYLIAMKTPAQSQYQLHLTSGNSPILALNSQNGDQNAQVSFSAGVSSSNTRPTWFAGRTGGDPSPFEIRSFHPSGAFFEQRLFIQAQGAMVINEGGLDRDTRFEGDNDANLLFVDAGADKVGIGTGTPTMKLQIVSGRVGFYQGADVASAAGAIAVGNDGNVFELTGTAAVTLISNLNWQNGAEITLVFTSTATLTDGTANSGTDIGMELAGNANFVGSADDVITLVLTEVGGTQRWREKSRTVN